MTLRKNLIRLASEMPKGSQERKAVLDLLASDKTAALSLGKADKKVIDAFLDKKPADSKKMQTNGKTLDILGMGGSGVAKWVSGKVELVDLGSRSGQTVHNYIKKQAPASFLKASSAREAGKYQIPRARRNTRMGEKFKRDCIFYVMDRVKEAMDGIVPEKKWREFMDMETNNFQYGFHTPKVETQEEAVAYLKGQFEKEIQGWIDKFGTTAQASMAEAQALMKSMDPILVALAWMVARRADGWESITAGSYVSEIYSKLKDTPAERLAMFITALNLAKRIKVPKL